MIIIIAGIALLAALPLMAKAALDDLGPDERTGPAMFESANGGKLTTLMPRARVVAESDGPFARVCGAVVMPWEASRVDSLLADVW